MEELVITIVTEAGTGALSMVILAGVLVTFMAAGWKYRRFRRVGKYKAQATVRREDSD